MTAAWCLWRLFYLRFEAIGIELRKGNPADGINPDWTIPFPELIAYRPDGIPDGSHVRTELEALDPLVTSLFKYLKEHGLDVAHRVHLSDLCVTMLPDVRLAARQVAYDLLLLT